MVTAKQGCCNIATIKTEIADNQAQRCHFGGTISLFPYPCSIKQITQNEIAMKPNELTNSNESSGDSRARQNLQYGRRIELSSITEAVYGVDMMMAYGIF